MAFLPGPPFCIFDLPLKQRLSLSSGLSSPQSRKLLKWKEAANNENHGRPLVLHLVWSHWTSSKSGGTCSHWWCGTFSPQGHKTHAFPNWGSQMHKCLSCRTIQPSYRTTEQTNKETKPWVTQRIRSGCSLASFHLSIFHVTLAGISWCKPHCGDPHHILSFCWFQLKTTSSRDRNRSHRTRPIWRAMWILFRSVQGSVTKYQVV